MLTNYYFSVFEGLSECLTCFRRISTLSGSEEDASNSDGTLESRRASCGTIGDSCVTIDVCRMIKSDWI
jgi:hypothetical protein